MHRWVAVPTRQGCAATWLAEVDLAEMLCTAQKTVCCCASLPMRLAYQFAHWHGQMHSNAKATMADGQNPCRFAGAVEVAGCQAEHSEVCSQAAPSSSKQHLCSLVLLAAGPLEDGPPQHTRGACCCAHSELVHAASEVPELAPCSSSQLGCVNLDFHQRILTSHCQMKGHA